MFHLRKWATLFAGTMAAIACSRIETSKRPNPIGFFASFNGIVGWLPLSVVVRSTTCSSQIIMIEIGDNHRVENNIGAASIESILLTFFPLAILISFSNWIVWCGFIAVDRNHCALSTTLSKPYCHILLIPNVSNSRTRPVTRSWHRHVLIIKQHFVMSNKSIYAHGIGSPQWLCHHHNLSLINRFSRLFIDGFLVSSFFCCVLLFVPLVGNRFRRGIVSKQMTECNNHNGLFFRLACFAGRQPMRSTENASDATRRT